MRKKSILLTILIFLLVFCLTACSCARKEDTTINTETASVDNPNEETNEQAAEDSPLENSQEKQENLESKSEAQKPESKKSEIEKKNRSLKKTNQNKNVQVQPQENVEKPCEHNFVEISNSTPTCTNAGSHTLSCSKCGQTYSEQLSPLGHAYGGWDITDSKHSHSCTRCGAVETASHTWHDDVCTVCGLVDFR